MAHVEDILAFSFSKRPENDKVRIVQVGRPKPPLAKPFSRYVEMDEERDIYDRESWLTGSTRYQEYFCWPCLLFDTEERYMWSSAGCTEFTTFNERMTTHKKTKSHLQSMVQHQLFLYKNVPEIKFIDPKTDAVERNRECLRRIIDAVCCLVCQQCPNRKAGANRKQLEVFDCVDVLRFLGDSESDSTICCEAIHLLKTSPRVLTDVLSSMACLIKESIKKETQMSTYVSLVLNEHSDTDTKSLLSTVLRYLKNGKVCERFVGFTVVNQYKSSNVIYQFISSVIEKYDVAERFVAYSVDGAVLASYHHMNPLRLSLRDDYPFSYFVPCYFHDLDLVLEQSVSSLKECKQFFTNLRSIKAFFSDNSKACGILEEFLDGSGVVPELDCDGWCNSQFLKLLKTHRTKFTMFFESVLSNNHYWEAEDLPKALAFQQILQDFETVFVLEIFSKVFNYTSAMREMLSSHLFAARGSTALALKSSLDVERQDGSFEKFWTGVISEMLSGEQRESKNMSLKYAMEPEKKMLYQEVYLKIIDLVIQEINCRFDSVDDLMFFDIFDSESSVEHTVIPYEKPLQSLLSVHGPYFNARWIQNEAKAFYANKSFFPSKSVYELLDFFTTADLKDTFKNLYMVAELILTMPCKPASIISSGPSKLSQINSSLCFVSESSECLNDLALLCIEEDFLNELKTESCFLNDVAMKFQDLNDTFRVVSS